MPVGRIRVIPAEALRDGFEAVRDSEKVPDAFAPETLAEAERVAAHPAADAPELDLAFVTIDPPGSRDLDQAMHIERLGDGHRVTYAIADLPAWVAPAGAIDHEAHARAVTVYSPDEKAPVHPPVLSEGAASLLPGQLTPALVWTLELDGSGELVSTHVERRRVRSAAQHTYADVPLELATLLQEVGERRMERERAMEHALRFHDFSTALHFFHA